MRRRVAVSTFVVVTLGSILHFAWEWSGRSPVVAVFAAMNESTWEHLKLAFWPALLIAPIQRRLYGKPPGWLPATAVRTILPPVLIVLIFHGYTAILGDNWLVLDIGTFVVAVFTGELAGHSIMDHPLPAGARAAAATVLVVEIVAFSTLSFRPPPWFLFEDPVAPHQPSTREQPVSVHIVRLGNPRIPGEGTRIGTVRRPPRGVPKDQFASQDWYDVWFPNLAPSTETMKLGQTAASPAQWSAFAKKYRKEMSEPGPRHDIALLAALSHTTDFSVGCYCQDEHRCHRSILRQLLMEHGAKLEP